MIDEILANYQKLCDYCDTFFTTVHTRAASHMRCALGCSSCCILSTVTPLEAHVIRKHLAGNYPPFPENLFAATHGTCVFLKNGSCSIYNVRPIICRTQGLPILQENTIGCCPLNFTEESLEIPEKWLFDGEKIADNLMRLNLAFCRVSKEQIHVENRVLLSTLASVSSH